MSDKVSYVKPAILDLGAIEVIYGQCAPTGNGDTGGCATGNSAGCSNGFNAATSHYYPGRPERKW
jgi:hypothetical protein